ncbi:MAG: hypothetical protein U0Y10_08410 [Spirosomataceae bacterium]
MKKQLKTLNLHTERVISLSAMKSIKGGYTLYCNFTNVLPPRTSPCTSSIDPTVVKGTTVFC